MSTTGKPGQTVKPVHDNGHTARAQRTRERLIRHATQRFLRDGFTNVRVEDLAEDLGMGKSTIYRNFPSKDELFDEVLETFQVRITSLMHKIYKDTHNWQERASLLTKTISTELQGVTTTALEDIRKNRPYQYQKLNLYRRRVLSEQIEAIVQEGQQSGEFRTDVEPFVVSAIVWSTVETMTTPEFMKTHAVSLSSTIERALSVVFMGIVIKGKTNMGVYVP